MFTIDKFRDAVAAFADSTGKDPSHVHLNERQIMDIVNEQRMKDGLRPEYVRIPSRIEIDGMTVFLSEDPGPHFVLIESV